MMVYCLFPDGFTTLDWLMTFLRVSAIISILRLPKSENHYLYIGYMFLESWVVCFTLPLILSYDKAWSAVSVFWRTFYILLFSYVTRILILLNCSQSLIKGFLSPIISNTDREAPE